MRRKLFINTLWLSLVIVGCLKTLFSYFDYGKGKLLMFAFNISPNIEVFSGDDLPNQHEDIESLAIIKGENGEHVTFPYRKTVKKLRGPHSFRIPFVMLTSNFNPDVKNQIAKYALCKDGPVLNAAHLNLDLNPISVEVQLINKTKNNVIKRIESLCD